MKTSAQLPNGAGSAGGAGSADSVGGAGSADSAGSADNRRPGRIPLVEVVITEGLDTRSAPRLTALLDEALALQPQRLVIDLAECRHIDATAIGLLLDVHRRTRRTGGALTVRSPSPQVRRNLQLTRADRVLHITAEPPAETATAAHHG